MRKIALVFFRIGMVGGINTWILNFIDAAKKLGYYVDLINIVDGNSNPKIRPEIERRVSKSGWSLVQNQLSIHLEQLANTIRILNRFDLIFFIHPCPHPVKGYKTNRNWQALYTQTEPKKATLFHDPNWGKLYSWIKDVIDKCDFVFGGQPAYTETLLELVGDRAINLNHPLNLDEVGLYRNRKKKRILWLSQWRPWKGMTKLFPELPKINAEIRLFNVGLDYYELRKQPIWNKVVKGNVNYYGVIEPERVNKELKEAIGVFDFSGIKGKAYSKGVFNYVGLEAMKYGAVVLASPNMIRSPSPLTEKEVYVVDMNDIAGSINRLLNNREKIEEITENALDYLKRNHDNIKETKKMLDVCFK